MRLKRPRSQGTPDRVENISIGRGISELFELLRPRLPQHAGACLTGERRTNGYPFIRILEAHGQQGRDISSSQRPLAPCYLPPILLLAITSCENGQKQACKAPLAQAFECFQRTGAFAAIGVMQTTFYQSCHFWRGPHG